MKIEVTKFNEPRNGKFMNPPLVTIVWKTIQIPLQDGKESENSDFG